MALLNTVKKISQQTTAASAPMALMFGEAVTADPLMVRVDNRFNLSGDMLIVPYGVSVSAGDQLILIRNQGGQQYLVIGRL